MEFLGEILCESGQPPLERRRWVELIGVHPNLARPPAREGINPFTKERIPIKPRADHASVVLDGREVGAMSWSEDDSILINVFGEADAMIPLARVIAGVLGGRFETHPAST